MVRLARSPPVVGLALAAGTGATLLHLGVPFFWTLLSLPLLLLLNGLFQRPGFPWGALVLAFLSGGALTYDWQAGVKADCRFGIPEGQALHVSGRLTTPLVDGRGELRQGGGADRDCGKPLRIVVPGMEGENWETGRRISVHGIWRRTQGPGRSTPLRSGYLRVDSLSRLSAPAHRPIPDVVAAIGGWVQREITSLFPRTAPLAMALVWARKEGLTPEIRESFARAGTAHLLAISGFHVGVVAGLLLLLLGLAGLPHPSRYLLASGGVWCYTLAIGLPDAAFRAALILSLLTLGRVANRAVAPMGALGTAFLGFLVLDPGALIRPGFQLSFAGTSGLIVGYRPISRWLLQRSGGRLPAYVLQGLAAGVSATVATMPFVAWHFSRVSLVGIPVTLLVAPLVALSIPGIFLTLLLSIPVPGLAAFLAAGLELVLQLLLGLVGTAAALPFASVWVSQATVIALILALLAASAALLVGHRFGKTARIHLFGTAVAVGVVLGAPAARLLNLGVLELVILDVGQGDAALLRSPGGRWVLVDAGPRSSAFDAGARTVVPYLRRRGVNALDFLILTHPDMDHVGGASSVLASVQVGAVLDPGEPAGTDVYLDALEVARARSVPWHVLEAGDSLNLDGMALRVVAPSPRRNELEGEGKNGVSVVVEVRFGDFAALLTGDAPAVSEDLFLGRLLSPRIQVLKVGHHGSSTSTTSQLLERLAPETALISVGRRNRFGHPDPLVIDRLQKSGARVLRTDLDGVVIVRAREDGSYELSSQRR